MKKALVAIAFFCVGCVTTQSIVYEQHPAKPEGAPIEIVSSHNTTRPYRVIGLVRGHPRRFNTPEEIFEALKVEARLIGADALLDVDIGAGMSTFTQRIATGAYVSRTGEEWRVQAIVWTDGRAVAAAPRRTSPPAPVPAAAPKKIPVPDAPAPSPRIAPLPESFRDIAFGDPPSPTMTEDHVTDDASYFTRKTDSLVVFGVQAQGLSYVFRRARLLRIEVRFARAQQDELRAALERMWGAPSSVTSEGRSIWWDGEKTSACLFDEGPASNPVLFFAPR